MHEIIEYQSADESICISREEQDRQEELFQEYQQKLYDGTISKEEYNNLFTIIHNCTMSNLKKRIRGIIAKYGIRSVSYNSENIEEMSLDGTLRMMKRMVVRKRYVRYIIKSSDYLAMYEIYNARRKFSDKVFKKGLSIDEYNRIVAEVDDIDIDESGEIQIKQTIRTKGEL